MAYYSNFSLETGNPSVGAVYKPLQLYGLEFSRKKKVTKEHQFCRLGPFILEGTPSFLSRDIAITYRALFWRAQTESRV